MISASIFQPGLPQFVPYELPSPDELPANRVDWTIDAARAVVLVHDMQGYFLRPFAPERRRALVANVATVVDRCRRRGVPVAYTAQPGRMSTEERGLLADFWGPGMVSEPGDQQVVPELAPRADDWMVTKWRYSAFVRSDLLERLGRAGRDQLVICGVYAHCGILMTAVDAFSHDIRSFVVADAVGDFTVEHHRLALDYTVNRCGAVTTTDEVLA